jgi:hypothetical protein
MELQVKEKQAVTRKAVRKRRPANRKGKRSYTDDVIDCLRLIWEFFQGSPDPVSCLRGRSRGHLPALAGAIGRLILGLFADNQQPNRLGAFFAASGKN